MPIYEYETSSEKNNCPFCRDGFERLQNIQDSALRVCPECGGPITRIISPPAVGASKSMFDDRAKSAGFSKLKRISKGEYEKQY